jgi:CheY-like chemotaxis protein
MQQTGSAAPARPKVLIIDDDWDLVKTLGTSLSAAGFVVESAADGEAGLDRVEAFSPDVVLLDLLMPRMDGWEVCRRLRKTPWTQDIPVVAMTGLRQNKFTEALQGAGFSQVILKPFDAARLVEVLKNSLS